MSVRVKICGITHVEDALAAVDAGADALGFMFVEASPRRVTYEQAAEIIRKLPPFVARVGVFVNPSPDQVQTAIAETGIDTLQFHGEEKPEFCRQFEMRVIKAFRVRDAESLKPLADFRSETWLLDSFVEGKHGGTGAVFNWDLASQAVKQGGRVILAGGLTPENVAEAVRRVRPYALDVSSGVELTPCRKDAAKVRAFIAAAKGPEQALSYR
jgi:phosphoribosylanthranilate isomerase